MTSDTLFSLSYARPSSDTTDWLSFYKRVVNLLDSVRQIKIDFHSHETTGTVPLSNDVATSLGNIALALSHNGKVQEFEAIQNAIDKCFEKKDYGGLGLDASSTLSEKDKDDIFFFLSAWFESLNSKDRARPTRTPLTEKPAERSPMTLVEKVFTHHAVDAVPVKGLKTGDLVRVSVDWIMASEVTWAVSLFRPTSLPDVRTYRVRA